MADPTGKTALVTGASKGMGRAIAQRLGLAGAVVAVRSAMNKGEIEVMGRTLARALGERGITVNTVAPGVVDTDMGSWVHAGPVIEATVRSTLALGRIGRPADVADIVASLASDDARWLTGGVLDPSGGQWLGPAAG